MTEDVRKFLDAWFDVCGQEVSAAWFEGMACDADLDDARRQEQEYWQNRKTAIMIALDAIYQEMQKETARGEES